ncbi:DUF1877 family protein [Salmonella enterica subsp. enterica]|nr:DUF1877 family protein [Salmonella enterica subsp. enterica]
MKTLTEIRFESNFFPIEVDEINIYPGNGSRKRFGRANFHCLMQEMDKLLSFYQRCLRNDSRVIIFIAE